MEQTLKSMEQMMQQLMEDRRQREEEIAAERAGWEKAADKRIQEMQTQTDALMTLVRNSQPSTESVIHTLAYNVKYCLYV